MNLFDLVNRPDRATEIRQGEVVAGQGHLAGASRRYVRLSPGAVLRIKNAHELSAFRTLSSDFGWSALAGGKGGASLRAVLAGGKRRARLRMSLAEADGPGEYVVAEVSGLGRQLPAPVEFSWPPAIATLTAYDFVIEASGSEDVLLLVGQAVDMRTYVLPYAVGRGVEVGPGLRPHVLPSETVEVSYIEQQHPHEWLAVYNRQGEGPAIPPEHVLERYKVGSAVQLETIETESLDFIFSNHVFEHLANPIQVMRNWLERLKPGGVILGVVPDPRFTFDCRQPPTTLNEALAEEVVGGHVIPRSKYERWCQLTEPRHTPEALIERGYSIHVNYFTPEGFQALADLLKARGLISRSFISSAPNNKDFAFAFWKAVDAEAASIAPWQRASAMA